MATPWHKPGMSLEQPNKNHLSGPIRSGCLELALDYLLVAPTGASSPAARGRNEINLVRPTGKDLIEKYPPSTATYLGQTHAKQPQRQPTL